MASIYRSDARYLNDLRMYPGGFYGSMADLEATIVYSQAMFASNCGTERHSKNVVRHTSAWKAKVLGDETLLTLFKRGERFKSKWKPYALQRLYFNRMLGLRPIEWQTAELATWDMLPCLKVRNAKHSNGRAHGEFRHLLLSGWSDTKIKILENFLKDISGFTKDEWAWSKFYSGVRYALYRMTRRCLGYQRKYPTLYSSRHQCSADMKSAGLTREEVAALMGHASTNTATLHYGRKHHGRGSTCIAPVADDVRKVRIKRSAKRSAPI